MSGFEVRNPTGGQGFERLFAALDAPAVPLERLAALVRERASKCFEEESDPWGQAWPPQSESTQRQRQAQGKPLGFAHLAVAVFAASGATALRTGASFPHARRFHFGAASGTQPPRPFLPVRQNGTVDPPEEMREAIRRVWAEGFREMLRG